MRSILPHPKPGALIKCLRENYLFCKENFSPYMLNGGLTMPDPGDIMMYISSESYLHQTFYKVLYVDTTYYILADAFKDDI
jgi:hypothetical protein